MPCKAKCKIGPPTILSTQNDASGAAISPFLRYIKNHNQELDGGAHDSVLETFAKGRPTMLSEIFIY